MKLLNPQSKAHNLWLEMKLFTGHGCMSGWHMTNETFQHSLLDLAEMRQMSCPYLLGGYINKSSPAQPPPFLPLLSMSCCLLPYKDCYLCSITQRGYLMLAQFLLRMPKIISLRLFFTSRQRLAP